MDRPFPMEPAPSLELPIPSILVSQTQAPSGRGQHQSSQLAFPAGTPARLLTDGLGLLALLVFVLAANQLVTRQGDRSSQSLAKECRSLEKLRIGYPVGLTLLESLRSEQLLEQRLGGLGVRINWIPYTSASCLLTDLSQGLIDFCGGGGTASLFSQAADHLFLRVAKEKYPELDGDAIVVPEHSQIHSLQQLKGKSIGFDEGSSAHYVLILALKSVGLRYQDINPVFLAQDQAARAFIQGELDAWVHWVPYAPSPDRLRPPARSIGDLKSIFSRFAPIEIPTLYYALPELVRDYPRILKAILEELNEAGYLANRRRLSKLESEIGSLHPYATPSDAAMSSPAGRDDSPRPIEPMGGHGPWHADAADLTNQGGCADMDAIRHWRQRCLERAIVPIDEPCLRGLEAQVAILSAAQLLPAKLNPFAASHTLQMRQNWTY